MENKSYRMEVDEDRKIIFISFRGNPEPEEVTTFHHRYMEVITPLQTQDYLLLLDSEEMAVPESERLHQMQVSFALYRKSGFKAIGMIIENDDLRKQILKLIRFSGITDISDVLYITPDEKESVIAKHLEEMNR